MFEAEIAGKLPQLAEYEDYLTSCVFGALKYLPPNRGLLPVLARARNYRLGMSLGKHCEREGIDLRTITDAHFVFWPTCKEPQPSEPDLVVILEGKPRSFIVPIEVKYFASKHGVEEDDQLMRYYRAVRTARARSTCNSAMIRQFSGEPLAVIYVTQFAATHEIRATRLQLASMGLGPAQDRIFGLKWQHVYEEIRRLSCSETGHYRRRILLDIRELLEHKHLTPFVGFRDPPSSLPAEALETRPIFFRSEERRD